MREASRDFPRLAWLNVKTYSSSMGSRKNCPGRKPEQGEAVKVEFHATGVPATLPPHSGETLKIVPEETTNEAAPVSPDIAS